MQLCTRSVIFFFSYPTGFNVTSKAEFTLDPHDGYNITCRAKILKPQIYYDFHLKLGILETVGMFYGYINETFLETDLVFIYHQADSTTNFAFDIKPPENITIVMKNLSQLHFLSDYLNTLIISKWKGEIASLIQKNFMTIMNDCATHFDTAKFRPFETY